MKNKTTNKIKETFMKKRIKIKFKNLAVLIIALIAALVILHDIYYVSVYSWISKITYSWTWYGFISFIVCVGILDLCCDYLFNYEK